MAEVLTRADSLREYLTGAGSDDGSQANPNLSLGGHRSSTQVGSKSISVSSAIANITVQFASGGNANGAGQLECLDANTLRWRDNGGTYGPSVGISNGQVKTLEANERIGAFLRVTRTSATALVPGTATVTLSPQLNNVFGMDDIGSAEALVGSTNYRCTMLKNVSASNVSAVRRWIGQLGTSRTSASAQLSSSGSGTVGISSGNFNDWPESGFCHIRNGTSTREIVYYTSRTSTVLTVPAVGRGMLGTSAAAGSATDTVHAVPGIAIATDLAGVSASGTPADTIADEETAPSPGVTWVTGITSTTGLNIGTMTPGQQIGIWMKREYPPSTASTPLATVHLEGSFDAS